MCGFSPSPQLSSPEISPESYAAFEELRLAIAKQYDVDPDTVQLMISRPSRLSREIHQEEKADA